MTENLIFVALSTFAERDRAPLAALESSPYPFRLHDTGARITRAELLGNASDAAVVIAGVEPYDAQAFEGLPRLRCIVRCGVGTDAVDLEAAHQRGITVLNTPDVPAAAVAELALAMFLSLSRNLRAQSNLMQARKWTRLESHLLGARTVGLVGLGRIGRRVAELSRAFGARVMASDPMADATWAARCGVEISTLDDVLSSADIVSLHAARTSSHPLQIGAAELSRMKRGAVLVNLARGGMVDEEALVAALQSGHLAGFGADVFESEPYAGPLCDFDQAILTPHSATMPVETRSAMEAECVDKAIRFLAGAIQPSERVV